jgi:uncharacterized protein HemX
VTSPRPVLVLLALVAALALAAAPAALAQDLGPLGPVEEPAPVQTEPEEADDELGFDGLAGLLVVAAAILLVAGIAAFILRDARRRAPAGERERQAVADAEDAPARARERERRKRQARSKGRAARAARRQNR